MAIKTISQFPSGIPTDNDYILFEQNGEGKSAKFSDFSLSYEEIMATNPVPDLSGKVASANALKEIGYRIKTGNFRVRTTANTPVFVKDNLIEGVLPTTVNTAFTVVTNSSALDHTTTLFFDELNVNKLIIMSSSSQNVGVNWISFY